MKKTKILQKILLGMLTAGILYLLAGSISGRAHLSSHYLITRAAVTGIDGPHRSHNMRDIKYDFEVNGRRYESSAPADVCDRYKLDEVRWMFLGKTFYVAYDSTNPKFSRLILRESDAEKFKVPVTDTIKHFGAIADCDVYIDTLFQR